jgi:hypothetical protein
MSSGRELSRAGSLPHLDRVHQWGIGRLGGRHRWQASSHRDLVQTVEIGRLGDRHREQAHFYKERGVHQEESGRLSGRLREQARSHIWIGYVSEDWSAWRPPSLASQLPQRFGPNGRDWSTGRPPSRAGSLLQGARCTSGRIRSAVRPPSRASSLPQKSKAAQLPAAKPHHSTMSASSSALDLDPPATSEG